MKVALFGESKDKILKTIIDSGFEIDDVNPEIVISYGGDGTLMRSETKYPNIPKVILKNSSICKLCSALSNEEVLEKIKKAEYSTEECWKVSVEAKGTIKDALNDITVHNADPRHAMRYKIKVNGKDIGHEIIGDGVVASTPFGSTGYYRSITDSFFELGLGLAFNNSTEQSDHMVLKEDSKIDIEITRGPASIYADNQMDLIDLKDGDTVHIEKSKEVAKIIRV